MDCESTEKSAVADCRKDQTALQQYMYAIEQRGKTLSSQRLSFCLCGLLYFAFLCCIMKLDVALLLPLIPLCYYCCGCLLVISGAVSVAQFLQCCDAVAQLLTFLVKFTACAFTNLSTVQLTINLEFTFLNWETETGHDGWCESGWESAVSA